MRINANQRKVPKWTILSLFLSAIMVAPLVLFTGCSQEPTGSDNTGLDGQLFFDTPFEYDGSVESFVASKSDSGVSRDSSFSEVYEVYNVSGGVIAVDGGSVSLSGGNYELEVPTASISANEMISVSIVSFVYNGKNLTLFEFGPDGLQFDPAATLRYFGSGLNSQFKSFNLYWLNPVTKRWEFQESKTPDVNGVVSFSIYHFSKYGVSE